ncbi:MAG: ATP-dependent DNA helicase [Candidatus Omnitrophota bacterium]
MDLFKEHYERLNSEQRQAVDMTEGALLVLAGPGTGKTQLLSIRAANIIQSKKARPENILILTFSNAARVAMRERLSEIIGPDGYNLDVETFHSFANSIVLESESAVEYIKEKIEIGEIEKIRALEYIIDNVKGVEPLRPFGAPYIHRQEIEKRISELKNEGIRPDEFKRQLTGLHPDGINLEGKNLPRLKALALLYENYEKLKNEDCGLLFDQRGRMDYDDMILIAIDALKKESTLRDVFRSQYKYVMVDEFQDTNGAQLELLFYVIGNDAPNVCCVGDDDQAIYRFQGASLANFRALKEKVKGLNTIELKSNYRSTPEIITFSNKIITQLSEEERLSVKNLQSCRSYDKHGVRFLEFSAKEEELAFLTQEIKRQAEFITQEENLSLDERAKPYNNIAVLVRKRRQIQVLIDAFLRAGIPYATDGKEDIRPEKRVRQMLDVLELAGLFGGENDRKSTVLYKVLSSDYIRANHADIIKIIESVSARKRAVLSNGLKKYNDYGFFQEFLSGFPVDNENAPKEEDSQALDITKNLNLKNPRALHMAAWAVSRLMTDGAVRPVHDLVMRYISDVNLHRYILSTYEKDKLLRIRDLRALGSFVNSIKESDLTDPALNLEKYTWELGLRETHGMPLRGELATFSQDGVRLYTAHSAKGLEFYTVFAPFCLQRESWPVRGKPDTVPLPPEIYKSKQRVKEKERIKELSVYDELRLFYVVSTRAKAHLIYTAALHEKAVTTQFLSNLNIKAETIPFEEEEFLIRFLSGSKPRDLFEGASHILKDMVRHLTLNPTSLNNYISCGRKFLYDNVLRLPGRKNQHLTFGNCAHKALEELYSLFIKDKKFPSFDFFEKVFNRELQFQGVNDQIKNWCRHKLETSIKDWYRKDSKDPLMPIDLENKLEIQLPEGLIFKGAFDKIEREPGGAVRVVDYKTGKPDDHVKAIANSRDISAYECDNYYRQLVAYKLLYDKASGHGKREKISKGMIQFLEPAGSTVIKYGLEKGIFRNEIVELTNDMTQELETVILRCWKDIRALKFDRLPERDEKKRCSRCEYDSICWG